METQVKDGLPRMAYLGNNKNNKDVLRFKVERKQLSTDSRMDTQVKDGLSAKDGLPRGNNKNNKDVLRLWPH